VIATARTIREDTEDGARPEVDQRSGAAVPSGVTAEHRGTAGRCYVRRAASLNPVIEHASLPSGGTVTIWVGIADDPYINSAHHVGISCTGATR
jgi:hypothetical protein